MTFLSVLDQAVVPHDGTSSGALDDTTVLARHADELGYLRFWVAEHHNTPTVASTTPSVLIAHLAASTRHIRVGSGGVMLPNHAPLAVAEQFALLEALHPGRIDLGIGRAPGADPATAAAFGRPPGGGAEAFPRDLISVMGMLGDQRGDRGIWELFRATPSATTTPLIAVLGSSNYSAQLAGQFGLPYAYAHHFGTDSADLATQLYFDNFRPSPVLDEPYLIIAAGALAAETDEQAEYIGLPSRIHRFGMRSNQHRPLLSPSAAQDHPDAVTVRDMPSDQLIGSADRVAEGLCDLLRCTHGNELMLTAATYDVADRVTSLRLIAEAMR